MELLLEVSWDDQPTSAFRVDTDPQTPMAEVVDALAEQLGAPAGIGVRLERTGRRLALDGTVTEAQLMHGDRLKLAAEHAMHTRVADAPEAPFELAVIGGPAAGKRIPLRAGKGYLVGRTGADITFDDPRMSRTHLHLGVGSKAVVVTDAGSANGTFVDGAKLTKAHELTEGQVIEAGTTLLSVVRTDVQAGSAHLRWSDGRELYFRPPRVMAAAAESTVRVPTPPIPPGKRRLPFTAAIVPVLMGGIMAYFAGPMMLIFALLSPVMLIITTVQDSRSGRRNYNKARHNFEVEMDELEGKVHQAHARLLQARRAAAPNVIEITDWVQTRSARLWERRPSAEDFLTLRIGTTDLPTRLNLELPYTESITGEAPTADQERVAQLAETYGTDPSVPADVGLPAVGVLGVAGEPDRRAALVRWLTIQAATLQSPRDLAIVGLLPSTDEHHSWEWLRWLPHTETLLSGIPGARTVATEGEDVRAVVQVVDDLITTRRLRAERGARHEEPLPWVLVVIPGRTVVTASVMSRLMSDGPNFGVSFIVAADRAAELPGECRAIVNVGDDKTDASVTLTASGEEVPNIILDGLDAKLAATTARLMAPLQDASAAGASGEVPSRVLLLDLLEMPNPTSAQVQQRWAANAGTGELQAPIGEGSAGPVMIGLRRDGPHGLTAGTTGSGKSELLLSYIGGLAATYPASTLTFVLVDYKGGAAFADCVALPHTVGFFTDLDPHLAQRALVSLNAELRRREHIFGTYGCKDLPDMERRHPEAAPANLFIVFDEFAFLKKEVPEFVAGVIDIAQRGRSLGVHLMLATQRPAGVIDDNIRANTNLRIALRMAAAEESNDVLDRDDAARIPKSLPGRGYVRVGHSDVTLVQSGYASARSMQGGPTRQPTQARPFDVVSGLRPTAKRRRGGKSAEDERPTDLQRLVSAIKQAHLEAGIPDQPPPWLEPLPDCVDLWEVAAEAAPEQASDVAIPIGRCDLPAQQLQDSYWYDPAAEGPLLIYGTSGTGKTQVLRTIAASAASRVTPEDVVLYALDFAGRGLSSLAELPHVGGVVSSDEGERINRLVAMLSDMVAERTDLLAASHAASLAEYRATIAKLPYILVFIDGYGAFRQTYLNVDRGELLDRVEQLVAQGRAVGMIFVITADRRSAVPTSLSSSISNRLVLRMADGDEYAALGLPSALTKASLSPGRGFLNGDELQIGVLGDDPAGAAQAQQLKQLAREVNAKLNPSIRPAPVMLLPERISLTELGTAPPTLEAVPLGLSGDSFEPVTLDLADSPVFTVLGSGRSGRSTALETLTLGLMAARPGLEAYLFAPRRTQLLDLPGWTEIARGTDRCDELARSLEDLLHDRERQPTPWLVVIDDGEELADSAAGRVFELLIRRSRDVELVVLASVQSHAAQRAFTAWIQSLRKGRHGIILDPQVDVDGDLFGVRLPRVQARRFPTGRGYLISRGPVEYVQVAVADQTG